MQEQLARRRWFVFALIVVSCAIGLGIAVLATHNGVRTDGTHPTDISRTLGTMRKDSQVEQRQANRLIQEKSPYLLQHAYNPVDWHPWGSEAFEKALRENKPIFLSIGYSTCHWCHVMEHESFEDTAVAHLMNETFVAIKVDREERPDIDNVYMSVCQMMSGSGGWPLTIIMTPDRKPFFAGTYFPRENRFGRIGMIELLPRIADTWKNRHDEVMTSAAQITAALGQKRDSLAEPSPDASTLRTAFEQLAVRFDRQYGGFGSAPKFPTSHNLMFLLRYWKRTGNADALSFVERTLAGMRRGGIYDQIGFGFHRYSTDREWLLPHFEKMLYDQALLIMAYAEAYQATGKDEYRQTAREIITYVLRDMTSAEGGFYSAEDADSEGEEGKFYVWGVDELRGALTRDDADLFIRAYGITPEGNYAEQSTQEKTGRNIPHLTRPLDSLARELNMPEAGLQRQLDRIRSQLYDIREKRVRPHKDDKILTDWNGLMIAALAKSAQAFEEPQYAVAAARATDFILARLRTPDGRLLHRYRDSDAAIAAHVDDYAFLIWGLLELYEASFDVSRLQTALDLNSDLARHFWDAGNGGFFLTADDAEELIARPRESYDGAVPSGNSVAMLNLLRLARLTGNVELEAKAAQIGRAFASDLARQPSAHTQMLQAVDFAQGPVCEVVIAGDPEAEDTKEMLRVLRARFLPDAVILLRPMLEATPAPLRARALPQTGSPALTELADFASVLTSINGRATAYVCRNFACQRPTNDPREMLEQMEAR